MDNKKGEYFENETYTTEEIAKGILFLLNEYYIGDFKKVDSQIMSDFGNGQKFIIEVKEI